MPLNVCVYVHIKCNCNLFHTILSSINPCTPDCYTDHGWGNLLKNAERFQIQLQNHDLLFFFHIETRIYIMLYILLTP